MLKHIGFKAKINARNIKKKSQTKIKVMTTQRHC